MNRIRLRSAALTGVLVLMAGALWLSFAPPQLGGSTSYVTTHGVSMEPRFHTGDLALVRPASLYRVGDVVAYHSSILHEVVLHRIVAIHGGRYTFKGDNNNFLDPVHPTRPELVGKLWLRIGGGGPFLSALHSPITAGVLMGLVGLLLIGGLGAKRGRGRGRRPRPVGPGPRAGAQVRSMAEGNSAGVDRRSVVAAAAGAGALALVLLGIALVAFAHPTRKSSLQRTPYTQTLQFGYHATASRGQVYPTGVVTTGNPIFVQLVHRLGVTMSYRLSALQPAILHGTQQATLTLSGPTGWSRTLPLTPVRRFSGDHFTNQAVLVLPSVFRLVTQVEDETGIMSAGYTATVNEQVKVHGVLGDQSLRSEFTPSLSFQLGALQLQPNGSSSTRAAATGFTRTQRGHIATAASTDNTFGPFSVATVRFLAPLGFLICLCAALTLLAVAARTPDFGESARIRAKYGHMIVPISAGEDLGWPAIDVGSIKALVRLAQAASQLILNSPGEDVDTYLVNDEGSVYRYQVHLPKIVWGEWTTPPEGEPVSDAVSPTGLTTAASRLQSLVHSLRGAGRSGT